MMSSVAKKLLMKPGQHWLIYNAPKNYPAIINPLPDNIQLTFTAEGTFNGIQLFVLNSTELTDSLKKVQPLLAPDTILWIIYPKKSSGITTDLEMMSSWDQLSKYGLGGVTAAAIDSTWTALRFKPQELTKPAETRNSELSTGPYSAYIDVVNKTITLPADVEKALSHQPLALSNYSKLSYSNKKEYVLWILTAKQEKTRLDRLQKLVDKLLNGKKNPSEK